MKKLAVIRIASICMFMLAGLFIGCNSNDAKNEGVDAISAYPEKPVQVIIPYGPGGGSDILTRTIMKYIELPNEQNLVAINVDGAAGYIGAQQAANAKNDGYSILAHNPMDLVSYTLNKTTEEPLWEDMVMICSVVDDFNVITTSPKTGWTSIEDVVEAIKGQPEKVKWGTVGSKNVNFGDTLRVAKALGIENDVTVIPYDGGAACKTALMGGHIQLETNSASDIRTSVESGDAIPLMVIGDRRAESLPGVPSTKELGFDIITTKPRGYYAPAGTDPAIIEMLATAIEKVTQNPEFNKTVKGLGLEVNFVRGQEMQSQITDWVVTLQPIFDEMVGSK